MVIKTR